MPRCPCDRRGRQIRRWGRFIEPDVAPGERVILLAGPPRVLVALQRGQRPLEFLRRYPQPPGAVVEVVGRGDVRAGVSGEGEVRARFVPSP